MTWKGEDKTYLSFEWLRLFGCPRSNPGNEIFIWRFMDILFLIALFVVASLYASVGHGGASGYLALMALFGVSTVVMKPSALILNIFVSSVAFIAFYRAGYFRWKILVPFIITSVPMAFIGAGLDVSPELYKKILGVCLFIATLRILIRPKALDEKTRPLNWGVAILVGAVVGFFSGMIGIGGGIILSPLLLVTRWANVKETAAISAAFILVNSVAGLSGHVLAGMEISTNIISWVVVAFAGGLLGSYIGSRKVTFVQLKYILAAVLIVASVKLFTV